MVSSQTICLLAPTTLPSIALIAKVLCLILKNVAHAIFASPHNSAYKGKANTPMYNAFFVGKTTYKTGHKEE
jgi:hypothetical protein